MVAIKPYGSWSSPVTAESLTAEAPAGDVCVDKTTGMVYWRENVAKEGRYQIFARSLDGTGETRALLPEGYSCRTRVHEYGGGSLKVQKGLLVFSNDADSRLYAIDLLNSPTVIKPITLDSGNLMRYADMDIDPTCKFLVCVREQHFENEEPKDVLNTLVLVQLDSGSVKVIAEGCDFYASPRLYGSQLAYVCWNHSNMPWDLTQLCLATVTPEGTVASTEFIAGKTVDESIVQPIFSADGTLYFASDRSGFWNLYRYTKDKGVELLLPEPLSQEFAGAPWAFNMSYFTPCESDPTKIVCINKDSLAVLDTVQKTLTNVKNLPYSHFDQIRSVSYGNQGKEEIVVLNVSSTTSPQELVAYSMDSTSVVLLRGSLAPVLDPTYVSVGKEIEFPTAEGKTAYAYFYEPKNPECKAPEGEKPPLRVVSHGGPTTRTTNAYSRNIQYWTTRGFAVVDVNYGGSTGYGREYRNRLKLKWGVVDVDDCCNAARYLADKGLVDPQKLAIEGGSAGGYTTLACLAFRDVFNAGCSSYGISDITLLVKETHKFESRYPDQLIPRDEKVYRERSPIHSADKIKCPVIFFQGLEDRVVPPSQSALMVETLKKTGVPVAYVEYPGESHGFRRAENIKRTLDLKLWFYGQIFGFPVEGVEGVKIYNYPKQHSL